MARIKMPPFSYCEICRSPLIVNSKIAKSHYEIAFGIHPLEIRQWKGEPLLIKQTFWFCLAHGALRGLMSQMQAILPYCLEGLQIPNHIEWLGHWITATRKAPDFSLLFNIQIAKRQFLDITAGLSQYFGNLPKIAQAFAKQE